MTRIFHLTCLALVLTLTVAGCGDDGGSGSSAPDAAPPDAIPLPPDGSVQTQCQTFCNDLMTYCSAVITDQTGCQAECEGLSASVRQCRIEHLAYASTEGATHCYHAAGDDSNPSFGTPSQCLQ